MVICGFFTGNDKINGWNSQSPTWNFCKYLINEKGKLLKYFGPSVSPLDTQITNYLQPFSNVNNIVKPN